jgi:hypothetical protein
MPSARKNFAPWFWIVGGIAVLIAMGKKAYGYTTKSGVEVPSNPQMDYAAQIVVQVWNKYGFQAVMTSGLDGEHREDSLHYSGFATDWRTKNLPLTLKKTMVNEVRSRLGSNYDVLLEFLGSDNEHMHIEYDPK